MGAIVYMATNLVNGKRYVGLTSGYLSKRRGQHIWRAKRGLSGASALARAILKYGDDMIRFRVIKRCETYDQAKSEEVRIIAALRPEYNQTAGGDGALGYRHTEASKLKMSQSCMGRPGFWKGKKLLPHVEALRYQRFMARHHEWTARAISSCADVNRKNVRCIETGAIYSSITDAGKAMGISAGTISGVCNKKKHRCTAGGYHFEFVEAQ